LSLQSISPRELHALAAGGEPVELIDVRTGMEFQEAHVEFAHNVPLDSLNPGQLMLSRKTRADRPLYVICRSGGRSKQACAKFHTAGFPEVVNVEGGTLAWIEAGLPVIRGKRGVSLERQVRIAAGLLVLCGIAGGWLVHPGFFGLSAFVGAGLVYAGVTDRCGMGLLLAQMPWNRGKGSAACGASAEPHGVVP
jgi:rhodanese-related sulfurtransferase